ncbi:efflux RND transporter periplasmic adaptor subunit [Maridesulfovibrio salexigens]|uniref:Efflux transporter, RND family, MFP subunit n=1 Tax=Maridesulfovibrio salexigens (strain ATCC 14822 / DSM 2638 / NCIMB 8403 / VKM B-1763) TaxID=526222 RepID=C6C291_MARSD|nr:efflux RND transporter periplasmic adaptor subunit [Maridesulfovibrio salexigens]ACS81292.1 efflux transporter, RND family, MFP subunit [Maridesulfovibrio salexigens DSM 2638]
MSAKHENRNIDVNSLKEGQMGKRKKLIFLLALIVIAGCVLAVVLDGDEEVVEYKTAVACIGNFTVDVAASGTLQPRNKVIVGCEISGTIDKIFKDYNDKVVKGELLARMSTDELQARVNQLRAALESSRANVRKSQVDLKDKKNECTRMGNLRKKNAVSQKKLDSAITARDMADAHLAEARAMVRQAEANLNEAEANLKKASITSPIDGLVLTRHVEAGQAVSSGMNTPELYTLATSLKEMRLELNVDEADVGKIKAGQKAVFTVDAYEGRKFPAKFIKLRYAPQRVQGVVTYVGIFSVDNRDLLLRPGMTAAAKIEIEQVRDQLIIPNGALRFSPADAVPESSINTPSSRNANIWILRDGLPQKVAIRKGSTNGRFTQIVDGQLSEGDEVILSRVEAVSESSMILSLE